MRKSNADQHPHPNHQPNSRYGRVQQTEEKGEHFSSIHIMLHFRFLSGVCDEAPSVVARLLIIASIILVIVTLPFSLCLVIKVVQVLTPQLSSLYARDLILGIREDCHLPTREDPDRGSAGPGRVLHHSLRGHL